MLRPLQAVGLLALLFFCAAINAQQRTAITFTLDFPGSQPEHYSIQVGPEGKGRYESSSKPANDSEEADRFEHDFTISPALCQRIFDLTAKAGYFTGDPDAHRKNMAFTGKKVLAYKDAQRSAEATFNYSQDPAVQELTSLFQALSATLEYGHQLDHDYRYQKLALDQDLKRLEEEARGGSVVELQTIAPILQKIVGDGSVINVTRGRAQRILDRRNNGEGQ